MASLSTGYSSKAGLVQATKALVLNLQSVSGGCKIDSSTGQGPL